MPATSEQSNCGAARRALLDPFGIAPSAIQPIDGDAEPTAAAASYAQTVEGALGAGEWDLVMLGLGTDGHTASLFSLADADLGTAEAVIATTAPVAPRHRVSLTAAALRRTRHLMFVVTGAAKADIVRRVISGDDRLPAARVVAGHHAVEWFLDRAAASTLPGRMPAPGTTLPGRRPKP